MKYTRYVIVQEGLAEAPKRYGVYRILPLMPERDWALIYTGTENPFEIMALILGVGAITQVKTRSPIETWPSNLSMFGETQIELLIEAH